jgi:polyisoprenoid-binding protein YceI
MERKPKSPLDIDCESIGPLAPVATCDKLTPMTSYTRSVLVALVAGAFGASAAAQAAPTQQGSSTAWSIDPNHTSAHFAVRHMLVSTVRGDFDKVSGTIQWDGKDVRSLSAQVSIDAASVDTRVASRDNDLRSANFFDVAKYPTITFVSTKAEPGEAGHFKLTGNLTMHGVTREVVLDVEGPMPPISQGAMRRTGASATTKIDRRDFGLLYNKMIEGAAVVGDDITITIDIEAVRRGG